MKFRYLVLSLLSATLLALPWYSAFSGLILLVAFVPLLVLERDFTLRKADGCWKYYTLTFLVWNAIATYWIYHATMSGAVGAIIGNTLQMCLIFALFRWVKKKTNNAIGYAFLVALWITWEWFYYDAEISWPWLVLGNGFAKDIHLIQWYEYTGVLGGSLWIWLTNFCVFHIITGKIFTKKQFVLKSALTLLLVAAPITISLIRFYNYEEKSNPCNVVILQPNIDPYKEKFDSMDDETQLSIMLSLAESKTDSTTDYVIAPETAISGITENDLIKNGAIYRINEFVQPYPQLNYITGATTYRIYRAGETVPITARTTDNGSYNVFNSSIQVNNNGFEVYHKSKLVIMAEKTPYPKFFKFLSNLSLDLGGYVGNYGTQKERVAFVSANGNFRMGTAICYESVYGEFYTEYIQKGANVMAIITNDGWWGNTGGYRQHLTYASLRAIETRRSIARSANTGISAVINQRGEIVERTEWWERDVLKATINANDKITFYVTHGDYLGRIAFFVFALVFLVASIKSILLRKKPLKNK